MELIQGPLGNKPAPKQVFIADRAYNLDQAKIYWSTAEKEIILSFIDPKSKTSLPYLAFLISLENGSKTTPINITSRLNSILGEWQQDFIKEENLKLQSLPPQLSLLLSQNTSRIRFSPDDNKILYQATSSAQLAPLINPPLIGTNPTEEVRKIEPQKYYVYDLKEDKNYYLFPAENKSDEVSSPIWYSDSQHLLIVEKDKIYILDYDGLNKRSVYSGPFIDNLVIPWPAGEKIIILTNFNQPGPLADLYEVDLR